MRRHPGPDQLLVRRAARHHGLVTREAAIAAGLTVDQIKHRIHTGRWERLARGVYRVAGAPETDAQRAYAAVLSAPRGALVAGLSALALVGVAEAPSTPWVVVPPTASGRTAGVVVRRSPISGVDRTSVGPIPATSPPRALLEAAGVVRGRALEALVDDVLDAGLATTSTVLGAIRRAETGSGRSGSVALRAALEPWIEGVAPESPAEARLLRRLSAWGFAPPERQYEVEILGRTLRLDLAWPASMVGIEYDGARWHGPRQLGADEARQAALRALGWDILRADRHDLAPSSTRLRDELEPRLRAAA